MSLFMVNETHCNGKIKCPCVEEIKGEGGSCICNNFRRPPISVQQCPCAFYHCVPRDQVKYTRCAVHLGFCDHPSAVRVSYKRERLTT